MSKRTAFSLGKGLVSVGLLAWVLHTIVAREGVSSLGVRAASLAWGWVLVAVLLQCLAAMLGTERWRTLLEAQSLHLSRRWLARTYLVGRFFGAFTPSTAGLDVTRAVAVGRATGQHARAASVVVVEKLAGLLGLALATGTTALLCADVVGRAQALSAAMLLAWCAACGLFLLAHPRLAHRLARHLPSRLATRVSRVIDEACGKGAVSSDALSRAVALGLGAHLCIASTFVAAGLALHVGPPEALLVAGNAIVLATLLPISIGGVGVREGVAVAVLASAHVAPADAALVAVLGYLAGQVPALLGGLALLVPEPRGALAPATLS